MDAYPMQKTLSIIMPAYNEEKTIARIVEKVMAVEIPNVQKELIIVDDGSTDKTNGIVRTLQSRFNGIRLFKLETNSGKGAAVRLGIEKAKGDIVIIQDADLEYDPKDYAACIAPIIEHRAKVVYGSRLVPKNKRTGRIDFLLGGMLVTLVTNILYLTLLTDEPTCYKTFDAGLVKGLKYHGNGFEWEPEITAKILKRGERIIEVPINYYPRKKAEGKKIGWRDGLKAVWTLIKYRFVD